ncbi:MAG: cytochrome c3 family protein [Carboxydocellales bacterium]
MKYIKNLTAIIIVLFIINFSYLVIDQPSFAAVFFNPHGNYDLTTEGCAICHVTHAGSGSLLLALANQKLMCYACHDGSNSNYNVKAEFGETVVGASVYSSYHPVPNNVQVCTTCHNPHLTNGTNPQLLAVGADAVSTGNAVCGQCHGPSSVVAGGDMLTPFSGTPHDVEVTDPASGTQIKCIRCHQPHGSPYKPMLRNSIVSQSGGFTTVTGNDNTVCFGCHSNISGSYSGSSTYNAAFHGTKTTSTKALVTYTGTTYAGTLCLNCHEPHGKTGISMYRRASGNTLCTTCHDDGTVVLPATYSYRGINTYNSSKHGTAEPVPTAYNYNPGSSGSLAWESSGPVGQAPTPSGLGTPATAGQKGDASSANSTFWSTDAATAEGSYNYQMYKFKVAQNITDIRRLQGTWQGYGEPTAGHPTDLLLWNKTSLAWEPLASAVLGDPNNPGTLSWSVSTDFQNYVDSSNNLYILARAMHDGTGPVITGANVTNGAGTNLIMNFNTDESAASTIYYGTAPGVYTQSAVEGTYAATHAVSLGGLTTDTTYYYKITSIDKLGNQTDYTSQFFTAYTPSIPTGLVGPTTDPAPGGNPTVNLTWTASTDPDPTDIITYEWEMLVNGSPYQSGTSATNSIDVTLSYTDGPYTVSWKVRAKDHHGAYSDWSAASSFPHAGPSSAASCPNLYVWNGEEYEFVTDIAGSDVGKKSLSTGKYIDIFPGLPVGIPWNMLQEKDGKYTIKMKSERDEVDYVDNVVLMAVDHPAGTRVALNDLARGKQLSKIYTYSENLKPIKKLTYVNNPVLSEGKPSQSVDVTELVSKLDNRETAGTYQDDNQLTFDLGDLNGAEQIKLVMTGWTEYASGIERSNALEQSKKGRMGAKTFIEILQPDGSWKEESIKHFSGMTKTVVLDLTGKFPKGTQKYIVRFRGFIRPHIDFAGLDTTPQAKYTTTTLELLDATLGYRGASTVTKKPAPFFDYNKLQESVLFHEGKYTKLGDVIPLVKEVDDKLVVMDSGDELTLNFRTLQPPTSGMVRSFILKPWVYYKENELAKAEPIPFRKMDMYKLPNSLGEYPAELQAYSALWNTRIHHAGERAELSMLDRLKQLMIRLSNWFAEIWRAVINKLTAYSTEHQPAYKTAYISGTKAALNNQPKQHFSLNTDYIELIVQAVDQGIPAGYCNNCHAPHGAKDSTGTLIPKQLRMTPDTACFNGGLGCHSDSRNSTWGINIADRFTAGSNATARHSISSTEQTALGTKVDCTNCHDPHMDTASTRVIDPNNRTTPYNLVNGMTKYVGPGGEVYVMVKSKHDGRPPAITAGPTISNLTADGATVTWQTDEVTTGYVDFGTTTDYGSTANSIASPGTSHTAYITGMVVGQNYHFRTRSIDLVGNFTTSADTLVDTVAPTISAPGPSYSMVGNSATITWNTNEASTSTVVYSPADVYAVSGYVYSKDDSALVTAHSITLTGLTVGTDYHFQVQSMDARGNTVSSADYTMRASDPPPAPALIAYPDQLDGTTPITVNLTWNPSIDPNGDTVTYYAQISPNNTFSSPTSSPWISDTSWSVSIDNWDDQYWYWRVMAKDQWGAESVWSNVYSFLHRGPTTPLASCPNLYVWNGEKYEFVTDIAGSDVGLFNTATGKYTEITPGLPVAIPWNMLQDKNGKYTIKIKAERDEVDFIDNVVLTAVDHPVGTRVAPNDLVRGKQPSKIYTYSENLRRVKKATYFNNPTYNGGKPSQPVDITDLVSAVDNREAKGTYGDDNQFTFDLGNLEGAKEIKLVMVGWSEFSDNAERAANQKKSRKGIMRAKTFLEILQPDGTWKKQEIKHFNGLTKTVVLDLNGKFSKGTKKYVVRLRGMLRPRIDFVGIDTTPEAKLTTQNVETLDAVLEYRGVALPTDNGKSYDYNKLATQTILHEGKFTRYGDVLPLINEVDDKLVVMDTGDELTLSFKALPPPAPGMTRTFILKPWVYYKEYELAKVEPVPFRKMDMYKLPNSLGEYPAELKKTLAEWNTRVHQAGKKPEPGWYDKLKEFLARLMEALIKFWNSIFGSDSAGISGPTQLAYESKIPAWWFTPDPEKHYSLNTNYITLQTDNTVTTYTYDINSPGSAIWDGNTEPTPSSPGNDASAHKAKLAADDGLRWTTDNYPTVNQDDGQYNYQMFKFALNTSVDKLYSLKFLWKGYGEPSPGYNTSLNIWNFTASSWEQVTDKLIGVDASMNLEKNVDLQPYCYKCHSGTVPAGVQLGPITKNIAASFPSDIHGGGDGQQNIAVGTGGKFSIGTTSGGSMIAPYARGNAALPCGDCHDTHGSKNAYHLRENLNGVQDKSVPNVDYANNNNVLNYCKSCHAGSLYQFHKVCLDCHTQNHTNAPAPVADDFGRACMSCHQHGGSMPAHGQCHCRLDAAAKAF